MAISGRACEETHRASGSQQEAPASGDDTPWRVSRSGHYLNFPVSLPRDCATRVAAHTATIVATASTDFRDMANLTVAKDPGRDAANV